MTVANSTDANRSAALWASVSAALSSAGYTTRTGRTIHTVSPTTPSAVSSVGAFVAQAVLCDVFIIAAVGPYSDADVRDEQQAIANSAGGSTLKSVLLVGPYTQVDGLHLSRGIGNRGELDASQRLLGDDKRRSAMDVPSFGFRAFQAISADGAGDVHALQNAERVRSSQIEAGGDLSVVNDLSLWRQAHSHGRRHRRSSGVTDLSLQADAAVENPFAVPSSSGAHIDESLGDIGGVVREAGPIFKRIPRDMLQSN